MIDELIRWSAGPGVRVRGGGSVGLMELISRTIHNGGGHMLGVVVLPLELIGDTPGELKAVSNMHHSKAEMDAFIILPDNYCSFLLFCERQRVEEPDLI
jgi:predicted Rossmann-fold nucleotide-binding protein